MENLISLGLRPLEGIPPLDVATSRELAEYHYSHGRVHQILQRISGMTVGRLAGQTMFYIRRAIKNRRMSVLHQRCADILDRPDSDLELVYLFEKYIPISGTLTSDEYSKLLDGIEPVSIPFDPVGGDKVCRACRNMNLRKETFQDGIYRYVTSIMGDISVDGEYSDAELERKVDHHEARHDVQHHKLGSLKDIATRPECSLCRLVVESFLRLSKEDITNSGYDWFIPLSGFDGVGWLSIVPDPVGDHWKNLSSRDDDGNDVPLDPLGPPVTSGRVRVILSILAEDEEPDTSFFQPPFQILHSEILPFAAEDEDVAFHARKWSGPFIDTERPQKWLHACENYHGIACSAPANYDIMEVHEDMLLIDLADSCLVSGFKSRRYFALSYVWGTTQAISFMTTKATIEESMKPGGLTQFLKEMANTITDAMEFAYKMNIRYLWVDALCIIQDDEKSKPIQINHMDAIYRQALLTIVAGDNLTAIDGISGLASRPREHFQRTYEYRSDLIFTANEAVIGDAEVEAMQSKWASRAWTFQERIFSRRLLIFADSTVHWNCACVHWSEAEPNASEDGPPPWKYYNNPVFRDNPILYLKGLDLPGDNSLNFVWQNVVLTVVGLELSFEQDILIAIAGMENYIAQYFNTSFIFGHPTKNFVDFLLWLPNPSQVRRRDAPGIPSWSWAGWSGTLSYPEIEPQKKTHEGIHLAVPTWANESSLRVSRACPHSGVLDIHTMTSKIRLVGSMRDTDTMPDFPGLGTTPVYRMPVQVQDKDGKCVGCVSVSELEKVDGKYEAIVIGDKLPEIYGNMMEVLAYWVMLIEWKGDVAERFGLGIISVKAWHETDPLWRDIRLG